MEFRSRTYWISVFVLSMVIQGCAASTPAPAYAPYGSLAEYAAYGAYDPAYWWGGPFWPYSPYAYYYGSRNGCAGAGPCRGGHKMPGRKLAGEASAAAAMPAETHIEAAPEPARSEPMPETDFRGFGAERSFGGFGGFGHDGGHGR